MDFVAIALSLLGLTFGLASFEKVGELEKKLIIKSRRRSSARRNPPLIHREKKTR